MDDILLSIIIPVYNVEKYLHECLDSIFNQPDINHPIEVIAVNDGSPDNSYDILREYALKHPNIRVIDQENKGLSEARNAGIKIAQGKYLMFVDSDDFLVPNSLGKLLDYAAKSEADVIAFNYVEQREENITRKVGIQHPIGKGADVYASSSHINTLPSMVWTRIYTRDLINKNSLFFLPGVFHEDEEWTPRVFYFADSVEYLPLYVYTYRIERQGAIMAKRSAKRYFDTIKVIDNLEKFAKNTETGKFSAALFNKISYMLTAYFDGLYRKDIGDDFTAMVKERVHLLKYSHSRARKTLYALSHILPNRPLFFVYDIIRRNREKLLRYEKN